MRVSLPVAALLLLSSAIAAVEDRDADLRLTIGMMPGIDEVEVEDATFGGAPAPAAEGAFAFDQSSGPWFEPSIMFRTDRGDGFGLVGGPLAYYGWSKGERDGVVRVERKLIQYGVGAAIGPSFQWDWLRLELLPFVTAGAARAKHEVIAAGTSAQADSVLGWSYGYGVRGGIYVDGFQGLVGLQGGWQSFSAQVEFEENAAAGQAQDTETITGSGLFLAVVFGVAF